MRKYIQIVTIFMEIDTYRFVTLVNLHVNYCITIEIVDFPTKCNLFYFYLHFECGQVFIHDILIQIQYKYRYGFLNIKHDIWITCIDV